MSSTQVLPFASLSAASLSAASRGNAARQRLVSVDFFRGVLVMGMVLVTNAGDWNHVYWPLKHADWNGSTPTDMIFPSFLFLAGVSTTFSFASRLARGATRTELAGHIAVRSLLLILLGLFLNGFPLFDMHNLRIPGVLQRIGLCYLAGGLIYLATSRRSSGDGADGASQARANVPVLTAAIVTLLALYWALMRFVPVPGYGVGRLDMVGNLGAYIDRSLMGTNHLWFWGGQMWDPEGLLSTLGATANLLLGILAGEWLRSGRSDALKLRGLAIAGAALVLAGVLLNPLLPINKKIWTGSFTLFSGGFSLLALALLYWLMDSRGWVKRGWLTPALIFGSNAILGFALANMLTPVLGLVKLHGATGKSATIPNLAVQFFSQFLNPWNASLAYAVCFVALNTLILWPLYRKCIFIRL
jgi:predicted acyltransferase